MTELTVPCPSGDRRALYAVPEGEGPWPGVVIIHDVTGLREDCARHCRRFAEAGYAAICPDLYAGGRIGCVVRVLLSMQSHTGEAYAVIGAARQILADRPEVDAARLGVVGFCMGGGFAMVAAADDDYAVAGPFYGAVPRRAERLSGICPTIAQYGQRDIAFRSHRKRLEKHLDELDVPHEVIDHPGVGHSFMNDHRGIYERVMGGTPPLYAQYDAETEATAWGKLLAFFSEHLPPASPR